MKKKQFFIGNVHICTKYEQQNIVTSETVDSKGGFFSINWESELLEKDIPILKLKNGNYVCFDSLDSLDSYIDLYFHILGNDNYLPDLVLFDSPSVESEIFIDKNSLVHYYPQNQANEKITINQVKEHLFLDPNNHRGEGIDVGCGPDGSIMTRPYICKVKRFSRKLI